MNDQSIAHACNPNAQPALFPTQEGRGVVPPGTVVFPGASSASRVGVLKSSSVRVPVHSVDAGNAVCPRCGRVVAVYDDGQLRAHRVPREQRQNPQVLEDCPAGVYIAGGN